MASRSDLKALTRGPIPMARNTYLHFYNGGKLRADFVGDPATEDDFYSEEWFFSTNRAITPGRENPPDKGFSKITLPSGQTTVITELLEAFPEEVMGKAHVAKYGTKLGLLVKLFDVGDGAHIPVHWHPSPEFSQKHLNDPYGKNESWIVMGTRPGAKCWIGFKEDVGEMAFRKWMDAQDVETMRSHMYEYEPKVGDVIYIRPGIVHSLGSGCCILEPQEPSDWNILAEWEGYPYGKEDAHLGLGWDLALSAAEFTKTDEDYLDNYIKRAPRVHREEGDNREIEFLPEETRTFFWESRFEVSSRLSAPKTDGYFGIVGTRGQGLLKGDFGEVEIRRGLGVLVPAIVDGFDFVNTGNQRLEGFCCFPPATG
jgi:mannose-6-phosphate isomerase